MFSNRSVVPHDFGLVARQAVPRSVFRMPKNYKTTFDAGYLVPVFCEEVLPGDTFNVRMTAFARLQSLSTPFMDNLHLESFFFFVPNRLLWSNWQRFQGEQDDTTDSTSFVIPQVVSSAGGFAVGSLGDYFGLPTVGQVGGSNTVSVNALPLRAYNLCYKHWFRDENLISTSSYCPIHTDDGPDPVGHYTVLRRGKRFDYFTSCLPWPQKGGSAVTIPLGTTAPVKTGLDGVGMSGAQTYPLRFRDMAGSVVPAAGVIGLGLTNGGSAGSTVGQVTGFSAAGTGQSLYPTNLYADLSTATAATINQLRQSFAIQELLELDARGGTRYVEALRARFGVISPDFRLQRPEYLGGGSSPIILNPIAQTSATGLTGGSAPLGTLAAMGSSVARHGFSGSFTEHGYILGLVNARADLTYQQGLRKMWSRSTRYDFYEPVFAHLGEQAVASREIYCDGGVNDSDTFGYQERWAEYRYSPSQLTGLFRSTSAGTVDLWHLAQRFTSRPVLGQTFILDTPPVSRVLAAGAAANGQQLLFDANFDMTVVRPIPMYSVPGLGSRF